MAECSFARCQQERRAIRKELQRWTKNMVYILGLERVAEELMGRRKWKLYQEGMLPREDAPPADVPDPPALKIKTIEQINARDHDHDRDRDRDRARDQGQEQERSRPETILESLIKRPPAPPKLDTEEPSDWKPPDKCYFCVDGEKGDTAAGPTSPQSGSDSSSVSGARSPAAAPPLLQHLLQLQTQSPHAIAQFQQMMATLAALGSGLVPPPALSQAWLMQRLLHAQQPATAAAAHHRLVSETSEKTDGSSALEQPLDLSAKPAPTATPPPAASAVPVAGPAAVHDAKLADNTRLKRSIVESTSVGAGGALGSIGAVAGGGAGAARRAYSDDELASALRDIQTGKLGTRRAALLYGIPRSTLRNKVYKLAAEPGHESEGDSDPERDTPPSVILKIPTFPPPDDKPASPAPPSTHTTHPAHSGQPRHAAHHTHSGHPAPLLLPPSVFADPPAPQHLFTSLSDVIAKSISQKFQQPLDRVQPELPFLRAPDRHVSVIKTPPDATRGYAAVGPVQPTGTAASGGSRGGPNNGQSAASAAGGKGTRPKRGKYRNYDRDSLVEAVKAVQRGEMSVHRAGSYYGVPHSTLEYKVKERHLMRPRKREPKPPLDPKPAPKPPPPKPMAKPFSNGLGANGPDPTVPYAAYPFWASGFAPPAPSAPDLYASHMMRRLRDEAPPSRTPPALPTHPPPSANGSFLEGIIRSSLERPGVAGTSGAANAGGAAGAALLQRLTAVAAEEPAARRPRLDTSDRQLAADMRDTVQRLRQDKLRPRNGTPTPPASSTPAPSVLSPESPPALSPGPAPPDRA